jgi:hypothetical protein
MPRRLCLLLLGVLSACERPAPLLQQVRQGLAGRDTRLSSYRFSGEVREEGKAPLPFTFAYRAPGSLRGGLGAAAARTFAYDGEHLYEQHDGERRFTTYAFALPAAARAGFLTELFSPFLPEGFRVPLLPQAGVRAERTTHRLAVQAVRLSVALPDGGEVQYLLRWPSLDFLGKRLRANEDEAAELRVEEEQCDAALRLCVPRRLTRWVGGHQVGETRLQELTLNPALPSETFRLAAPAGYEARTQTLVAQDTGAH